MGATVIVAASSAGPISGANVGAACAKLGAGPNAGAAESVTTAHVIVAPDMTDADPVCSGASMLAGAIAGGVTAEG